MAFVRVTVDFTLAGLWRSFYASPPRYPAALQVNGTPKSNMKTFGERSFEHTGNGLIQHHSCSARS